MTLGIVDVGTNSIHLVIGRIGRTGACRVLRHERVLVRLGDSVFASGKLAPAAMRRALRVLQRYAVAMRHSGVDRVEAVATSAVREATNGQAFVHRVRKQLGLPLRIISGLEEARLSYLGVNQARPFRQPTVLVTIGGGSAQVIYGTGPRPQYVSSVRLGGVRLAKQFLRHDPPLVEEVAALYRYVRRVWAPVVRTVRRFRCQQAFASSSMIDQLMMAARHFNYRKKSNKIQPLTMTRHTLRRLVDWLSTSIANQRRRLIGLDPHREDLALSTGVALLAWMEECQISTLKQATGSLREGLVADSVVRFRQQR